MEFDVREATKDIVSRKRIKMMTKSMLESKELKKIEETMRIQIIKNAIEATELNPDEILSEVQEEMEESETKLNIKYKRGTGHE
ncbi:hypothetical protein ACWKTZ_26445 [Bacillus cereus]|uniref:hypothetical protein n=1 Tax=Bacillus cereus TaxID=1396 RepID=UPI0030797881